MKPQPVIEGDQYDTYRYNIDIMRATTTHLGDVPHERRLADAHRRADEPAALAASNPAAAKARAQKNASVVDARFLIQTYVSKTGSNLPTPSDDGR